MRHFSKFAILILSVIGLVQSLWLIGLVVPIDYLSKVVIGTTQTSDIWIELAAFGFSILIGLTCIIGILFSLLAPTKVKSLKFHSPNGKLSISQRAVEKVLQEAILSQGSVTDVKANIRVTGRKRKTRVRISSVGRDNEGLVKIGEEIQMIVVKEIGRIMDIPVKKVSVKVKPRDSMKNKRTRQPRVV